MNMFKVIQVILLTLFISCKQAPQKTLFTLIENSSIDFENKLTEAKNFNVFKYRNFYNGGGVAIGDLNKDGLPEVFFTSNQGSNKLYQNKGNFLFDDISTRAGFTEKKQWSTGVVLVDINGDSWLDIYVCNAGNVLVPELRRNQLFINNHDLTFTESAKQYGLDNDGFTTQASFFDYDMDGDLDCIIVNNSPIPVNLLNYANMRDLPAAQWSVADFLKGGGDHLYRNDKGKFIEVTKQAGIHGGLISLGLGVTTGDINGDGYPDVYVSNDFFERDYLYINQKNGTFIDELEQRISHTSLSSMGADMQDLNNDGYPDIFTTDMLPENDYRLKANSSFENFDVFKLRQSRGFYNQFTQNALQVNIGGGKFVETAFYSGVAATDWSWGALLFDADNDGLTDIYVSNGIYRDITDQDFIDFFANEAVQQMVLKGKSEEIHSITDKMPSNPIPNKMFKNSGELRFEDTGDSWGLSTPSFSNGAAYADLDNDGDLDLIVNNVNQKAMIYRNNSRQYNKNNYIAVLLKYPSPNSFGIGSKISIYQGNQVINREITPGHGFQSSADYRQTIGLGMREADSMTITWPDRTITSIGKPAINKLNFIEYSIPRKTIPSRFTGAAQSMPFEKIQNSFDKHSEDNYVDFYYEMNIPFMLSRQGPKAAAGDVNGDGLTDIYIGGAKDQPGQLYFQTGNGFIKKEMADFKTLLFNEVTAALFFDCDGDNDLDLFTGGGGNFAAQSPGIFQNLLYLNDGKGNFTIKSGALPHSNSNCGIVIPMDYNGDGKMDLFIGNRSVPQNYGEDPPAYILQNDGKGNYADVTHSVNPEMRTMGMVTAGAYADINGDRKKELIVIGDWMYPHVYVYNGKVFKEIKTNLENFSGWWQSMAVADVDQDGDQDLILGNIGQNFYLHADSIHPVRMWIKDFDQNGTTDKIITRTVDGKDVPVFMRRDITDQIPSLKRLNLKHLDYAKKSIQQLFGTEIDDARLKQVNYVASCIAYNDGTGNFNIKNLPKEIQLSSVNAIEVMDINKDGYTDIIAAGNFFDLLPQFCRLDASYGHVLLNNQKGIFTALPVNSTGLHLSGQARDVLSFRYKKDDCILFLENDVFPTLYKINQIEKN